VVRRDTVRRPVISLNLYGGVRSFGGSTSLTPSRISLEALRHRLSPAMPLSRSPCSEGCDPSDTNRVWIVRLDPPNWPSADGPSVPAAPATKVTVTGRGNKARYYTRACGRRL
jgi:hypothetical protein